MKQKKQLFKQMESQKKLANDILFCEQTIDTLAHHFDLPSDYTIRKTRKRQYVFARQIGMYFMSKHTSLSLERIGLIYNGKDHATVIHSKKTIGNLMDSSKKIKNEIHKLEKFIIYKMKVITQKKTIGNDFYYLDFDSYTSIRFSDEKGILITGFNAQEIQGILEFIGGIGCQIKKHENTGHYILEKNENDTDT